MANSAPDRSAHNVNSGRQVSNGDLCIGADGWLKRFLEHETSFRVCHPDGSKTAVVAADVDHIGSRIREKYKSAIVVKNGLHGRGYIRNPGTRLFDDQPVRAVDLKFDVHSECAVVPGVVQNCEPVVYNR